MISKHDEAFACSSNEMGCVNLKFVAHIIIFTIPHVPWNLKSIPMPKALLFKLVNHLEEKMQMRIHEPFKALLSNNGSQCQRN